MRLSAETLALLPREIARFGYDRDRQDIGIVHFGMGAFARAHLATYCDAAMSNGGRDWMIAGVSLRSGRVAQQLNPQDGLYTVTERSGGDLHGRLIGSVREVLVSGADNDRIVELIGSANCRIVSFTITEKGYCTAPDGRLDLHLAASGFYPLLTSGLERRRQGRLAGITLLSCDNLSGNGASLDTLIRQWLEHSAPGLLDWYVASCCAPNSMVDRIVPATSAEDRLVAAAALGFTDEGAVFTEPFSQWVIEDDFASESPDWGRVGAEIVADVGPYEEAKLRMLNGAHSFLAYAGLACGYDFVHQAMADPWLRDLAERLMFQEAAPTVSAGAQQDLARYAGKLSDRFDNPALQHRLSQIAMDGSQKIPMRWLRTLAAAERECPAIHCGIAAWILHIEAGTSLNDPLAADLRMIVQSRTRISQRVSALFGASGLLASNWRPKQSDLNAIEYFDGLLRGRMEIAG